MRVLLIGCCSIICPGTLYSYGGEPRCGEREEGLEGVGTVGKMVASALFIMDLKGKIIISRNFRGDVPMTVSETFR